MRRQIMPALSILLVLTVLTGLAYPLAITGIAQGLFHDKANGSLIERNGQVIGSELIGQPFTAPEYFHPRPSAAGYAPGPGYSYASNYGPTNDTFLYGVEDDPATTDEDETYLGVDDLVVAYREENALDDRTPVPVDAVTGSGSGLDPHISVANASLQARRVAEARGLDIAEVQELIDHHTDGRALRFMGEKGVNVLELNLALDEL